MSTGQGYAGPTITGPPAPAPTFESVPTGTGGTQFNPKELDVLQQAADALP